MLVTGFAATVAALRAGRIDMGHVRLIQDAGARIDDPEARARFEQAALVVCERETPGRARPIVAMIAQKLHPVPLEERHADAAAGGGYGCGTSTTAWPNSRRCCRRCSPMRSGTG